MTSCCLVLSEHSVNSQWVEQEVETALRREREENATVLFPVRLDDAALLDQDRLAGADH